MRIVGDLSVEVPDTNAHHWSFNELSDRNNTNDVFMYGYNAPNNVMLQQAYSNCDRKIFFNNWAPCEFAQQRGPDHDGIEYDNWFNEIYSICPYTSKWLNTLGLEKVYKPIFYPFHKKLIPTPQEKLYDIIYHGGIHGAEHINCLRVMSHFNYRFCTMNHHINAATTQCLPFATNINLAFQEKINLIAQTKVSVCYNLVHIDPQHIPAIQSYPNWKDNEAFSEVEKWNVMPQFKTRMHEAAISKTLNLVQRDQWNIAEQYYEPERDFFYFNDPTDLLNKTREIVADWETYEGVVESAYQKAMKYTTENFIQHIREDK
jgi:hypothetical protein